MISAGEKPDLNFTVKAVINGEEKELPFRKLLDRPAIVSVYMKNNTSSCDRQTKSLAEESAYFDELGYSIIAISKDGCRSHKRYADKQGINYILVSDPDYQFANATDSIVEKKMYGKTFEGPSRSAFVLDEEGTVKGVIEKVDTKDHAGQLKSFLESL